MPNIPIYVKDELYAKFINADKEVQKQTKIRAVEAMEESLNKT